MKSNNQTAMFLANERINDHLANVSQAKPLEKSQENKRFLYTIPPIMIVPQKGMKGITGHLVNTLRGVGGARTATR